VMIRRAFDTSQSVAEGFLCLETSVSYVLKPDTTGTAMSCLRTSETLEPIGSGVFCFSVTPRARETVLVGLPSDVSTAGMVRLTPTLGG
jgi:hypothetical protein